MLYIVIGLVFKLPLKVYFYSEVVFMATNKLFVILILNLVLNFSISKSQSYIADTIKVTIQENDSINFRYSLRITDHRKEDPRFISVYEKKKLLF